METSINGRTYDSFDSCYREQRDAAGFFRLMADRDAFDLLFRMRIHPLITEQGEVGFFHHKFFCRAQLLHMLRQHSVLVCGVRAMRAERVRRAVSIYVPCILKPHFFGCAVGISDCIAAHRVLLPSHISAGMGGWTGKNCRIRVKESDGPE